MSDVLKKGRKRKISKVDLKWEGIIERNLKSVGKSGRDRIFASAAGLCERQTAGLMLLFDESGDKRRASTQFYFKIGNAFEDVMSKAFQKAKMEVDRETRIEAYHAELPVSGRIDFILRDPENDELVLMELKTCGKLPTQPKPAHLAQLMVYLTLTGQERGLLWYVSRTIAGWDGDLKQRVFEIEPTAIDKYNVSLKMAIGALAAKQGMLPPKPDSMKRYKCGFCTLIPHCWEGKDVGIRDKTYKITDYHRLLKAADEIAKEVVETQPYLNKEFQKIMG
jgi:hypothetical protein